MSKEHKIETLTDIMDAVTLENKEAFVKDFSGWLDLYLASVGITKAFAPEKTKGKKNSEIIAAKFKWIDDGEHNVSLTVSYKLPDDES